MQPSLPLSSLHTHYPTATLPGSGSIYSYSPYTQMLPAPSGDYFSPQASFPPPSSNPAPPSRPTTTPANLILPHSASQDEAWAQAAYALAHAPRRRVMDTSILDDGPLPAADYSFGTGGAGSEERRASTVSNQTVRGPAASAVDDAAGSGGSAEEGSPDRKSNKTTTPTQTTPKQGSPAVELSRTHPIATNEMMHLQTRVESEASTISASSSIPRPRQQPQQVSPSSTSRARPQRPTIPLLPHPLDPRAPSSALLYRHAAPPSASSTSSWSGINPLYTFSSSTPMPSPIASTSIGFSSSSRFGSIDSGRISLWSNATGNDVESVSSVNVSERGYPPTGWEDDSMGGAAASQAAKVFERDVEGAGVYADTPGFITRARQSLISTYPSLSPSSMRLVEEYSQPSPIATGRPMASFGQTSMQQPPQPAPTST